MLGSAKMSFCRRPTSSLVSWVKQSPVLKPRKNQQQLHPALRSSFSSSRSSSTIPPFGIMFDIDGVIVRGRTVLPSAPQAFQLLVDQQTGDWRVPTIFITNASNTMRQEKADQLSSWLNVNVTEDQVVMAHSPFKMFSEYHNKHVLVVGQGPVEEIARSLGFNNVTTMDQLRHTFPTLDTCDHKRRATAPTSLDEMMSFPRLEAVVMFGESIRWETSLQLLIDVLMSDGHPYDPPNTLAKTHIPLLACNMDLQWMAEAPLPRFGHGAFLLCLENLYKKVTGRDLIYTALVGKPSEITYRHGEHMLQLQAKQMGLVNPVKTIYCIGDNICTDIFGANLYDKYLQHRRLDERLLAQNPGCRSIDNIIAWTGLGGAEHCHSVLVNTGVFSKENNGPKPTLEHCPRDFLPVESSYQEPVISSDNVLEAVSNIFAQERFQ